jgi:F-type H+-transporting ATPase subunit delta
MADTQAARRYAQAAFGIASETDSLAMWREQLAEVGEVLSESGAASLFADGRRPAGERIALLERVLDVDPLVLNLAKLLILKGRTAEASAIAQVFAEMVDAEDGVAHAVVTTAVDLSAEQLTQIESTLSEALGVSIDARAETDPNILGGLVVRVGDRLIDGSLRSRLESLRQELVQAG